MKQRDDLIDFLRGLCLVFMVFLHTKYMQPHAVQMFFELFNFVAGGFVFLAGAMIGHISVGKYRDDPRGVGVQLLRRAAKLYGIQVLIMISYGLIFHPRAQSPVQLITDAALIRRPEAVVNVLPMFIAFFALAPAMLWIQARGRAGGAALALLSAAVFILGQWRPYIFSLWGPSAFPVILWQAFFVAGIFFGKWHKPSAMRFHGEYPRAAWFAALSLIVFAVLAAARFGFPGGGLSRYFIKFPLSIGWFFHEISLNILLFWAAVLLYRRISTTEPYRWLAQIGRHSLNLFVLHIYLAHGAFLLAQNTPPPFKAPVCLSLILIVLLLMFVASIYFERGQAKA